MRISEQNAMWHQYTVWGLCCLESRLSHCDVMYLTRYGIDGAAQHTIGRYEALNQTDRDHRNNHHSARVRAVAGLVNRQLRRYLAA